MYQQIGIGFVVVSVLVLLYYVWDKWLKVSTTTTTSTTVPATTPTTTTATTAISSSLDTTKLVANLGYVEVLSKVLAISASPDATKALMAASSACIVFEKLWSCP